MTIQELQARQQWTLAQKIDHSLGVIDQFASHFGRDHVYVSFSGGKDSVVMLSLVEVIVPRVKCMFVMTGCESPSVCRFVRQQREHHDIDIVRPVKTLRQIFAEYGFPLVSKQVAHDIECVRRNPYCQSSRQLLWRGNPYCIPERWMYLLNEPYDVSSRCCFWLKHKPGRDYERETGRHPFVGLLAEESRLRMLAYIRQGGCNTFSEQGKNVPHSLPLAIWTERDVWQYISDRHLALPDIYSQGATRTGCMGCGFGAPFNTARIDTLRRLWPRWYDMVMSYENHGVRYGDALLKTIRKANGNTDNL